MTISPEKLEQRRDRGPRLFTLGGGVALAGIALGIGSIFVSPTFQHGPGRGEIITPDEQVSYPTTPLEEGLLFGASVLILSGGTLSAMGVYQMARSSSVPTQVEAYTD